MSEAISGQACLWLCAAALGAALLFFYDLLRIFRRILPHGARAIGAEDFFYWLTGGALLFALLYHFNNGIIRWFAVFGLLVGMLLYHLTLGAVLVERASRLFNKILKKVTIFLKKKLKRRMKEGKMGAETKTGVTGVEKKQEQKPQQTE